MKEQEIFSKLLSIKKESDIDKLLNDLQVADSSKQPKGERYVWRFLGNSMSNAANIHTTSVTIAPIIERITNSFDAMIQLKEYEKNEGEPQPKQNLPRSPREAVEKWFEIPKGDTAIVGNSMDDAKRTKFAESIVSIELHESDIPRYPTIVVSDKGIGQEPDEFPVTLLSLGNSNKFTSPHLHGTYGHGGSSTYRFCKYSIVLSRRSDISKPKNRDLGWTVIRRNESLNIWDYRYKKMEEVNQPPIYEYLCLSDGSIPHISSSIVDKKFEQGTYIVHIQFDAKDWENLSRGLGYRLFRNYLFDPVLPFRLIDRRKDKDEFSRNMFGDRSTLSDAKYVKYHNEAEMQWTNGGKLIVRYWLLHDENNPASRPLSNHLERENSRNTIIVTLNGQRHGSLEKSLIVKKCRLPRVGDSLLVQVVLDGLPREAKGKLFTSGREKIVEQGDEITTLESKLIECFTDDDKLREWEDRLGEIRSQNDETIKEVTKILDKLITIGIESGIGGSDKLSQPGGTGTTMEYKPHDPPTSFKIKSYQDPLEITKEQRKTIQVELNGPDNLFTRRKNRGYISCILPEDPGISVAVMTTKFKNGRLPIIIFAEKDAKEFEVKKLKLIFESENLTEKLISEKKYTIIPEETYISVDPPTEFRILRNEPIILFIERNNTIPIIFNGPNDILTRPNESAELNIDFNYDNAKLVRRIGPYNGKFQITLYVDSKAEDGNEFNLSCKLTMSDGTELLDNKKCKIKKKRDEEEKQKGSSTTVSRPNYEIKHVHRIDWPNLGWNEENVGKFDIIKDSDGKDKLRLIVNVDNCNIEEERSRRRRLNQTEKNIQNLENKYVAHIAYHLYQQYDYEKEDYNQEVESRDSESEKRDFTEEQKAEELKRVSKTLVLSFKTLKSLDDED